MTGAKWNDDQIAKLKSLAGKVPARDIAAELGRSPGALAVQASKLKFRFDATAMVGALRQRNSPTPCPLILNRGPIVCGQSRGA